MALPQVYHGGWDVGYDGRVRLKRPLFLCSGYSIDYDTRRLNVDLVPCNPVHADHRSVAEWLGVMIRKPEPLTVVTVAEFEELEAYRLADTKRLEAAREEERRRADEDAIVRMWRT